jgi:carboxyl-terminal processing protease
VHRQRGLGVLIVCGGLAAAFSLDRPRHTDLSPLGWSAAFAELCAKMAHEYPFTAWKGIDWPSLARELGPRVAHAEAAGDRRGYYLALRELVWRLRDGHAHLEGDDAGLRRAAIGGSFGLELIELDDGRVLAGRVATGGPAAVAAIEPGAEIVDWNGRPAGDAVSEVAILWSDRPPATREGRRLAQLRLLDRAPVGAPATLTFHNRGTADARRATLAAAAAPLPATPHLSAAELLTERAVETRTLPEGAGYVRIRFELPALRTPFPGPLLRRALGRFAAAGLPGVVVDVRGNGGGLDLMVPPLVAPFLREALLYELPGIFRAARGRFEPDPRQALTVLPRPPLYRGRIAVLIDGDTVSAGEAIPFLLQGLPDTAIVGFHATHGSFGIGLKSVRLPAGLEVVFPHAQSLDAAGRIEVDGDARGRGGVEPNRRLPLTAAVVERWLLQGQDPALAEAVRFVRGEPSLLPAMSQQAGALQPLALTSSPRIRTLK